MKSPIKIFAIVAIVIGCFLLDAEYHWMPWWEKAPVEAPADTTATTWISSDTAKVDTAKIDTSKIKTKITK